MHAAFRASARLLASLLLQKEEDRSPGGEWWKICSPARTPNTLFTPPPQIYSRPTTYAAVSRPYTDTQKTENVLFGKPEMQDFVRHLSIQCNISRLLAAQTLARSGVARDGGNRIFVRISTKNDIFSELSLAFRLPVNYNICVRLMLCFIFSLHGLVL